MIRYCAAAPRSRSTGRLAKILKSSLVSVRPMQNMMKPMMSDDQVKLLPSGSTKSLVLTHAMKAGQTSVMTAAAMTNRDDLLDRTPPAFCRTFIIRFLPSHANAGNKKSLRSPT